ncbi:hypothetical protein SDC9_46648 [bioreactor metagenome]|uniref:Zeta toxin domain-containing protein n=1 Tax=bioreactor metagenome TaxID=1076179 RepID=A0A644WDL4_9ZZZZ
MAVSNIQNKRPELRVYAGPNGSGKSTITTAEDIIQPYINADDIQKERGINNIDAARIVTQMRNYAIGKNESFYI